MVCDSFKNLQQYTDEALKRVHLWGVQMLTSGEFFEKDAAEHSPGGAFLFLTKSPISHLQHAGGWMTIKYRSERVI